MLPPNVELYFDRILGRLRKHFPPEGRVLDVGCREGDDARLLQRLGCRVVGIDIEDHSAAWAKIKNPGLEFQVASAEALPFSAGSFDAVWAKDALHHMQNPETAIAELMRVAKPGAAVVLVEANRYNPLLYVHMTLWEGHEHFSRKRFRKMLAKAGEHEYFMLESRCLPWSSPWILAGLKKFEDALEALPWFRPWLTYQVGILSGRGE